MDKQQFHEQLTKTSKALLRERVNNARGVFDFLIFGRKNKKVEKSLNPNNRAGR